MKIERSVICIFTVVLIVFLSLSVIFSKDINAVTPFYAEMSFNGGTEKLNVWQNEEKDFFLFLPSYAELDDVRLKLSTENEVSIGNIKIYDGIKCNEFDLEVPYKLFFNSFGKKYIYDFTFLKSENVSAMHINTESGNMDYIHSQKGNEESGEINLYNADGEIDYKGSLEAINGRGNNTWESFDKKPYSIKLTNEADLLGLGKAQKWILLANADDPSNMRNKIVYEFAEQIGLEYSPDTGWVDLYLNGEYAGLYLLSERNEIHNERVNISETDSFLVSLEREDRLEAQGYSYITTNQKQDLRIHYPANPKADELLKLTDFWQSVENAIISEDGIDSKTGKSWDELIDLESWTRKYLVEEIFGSGDACYISQFFYCDFSAASAKIKAGPVWDFDHSIGTEVAWELLEPNTLYANRLKVKDGYDTPWFYSLCKKDAFYNRVTEIYESEFLPLLEKNFSQTLKEYALHIGKASSLNQIRWDINESCLEQSQNMSDFMEKRLLFLNELWIENESFNVVKADHSFGGFYAYYYIKNGETLSYLPLFDSTKTSVFRGWYYEGTDEPFDPSKPIYEDTEIYAKWQDNRSNKTDDIIKLLPLAVIAVIFMFLFLVEIQRIKGNRVTDNDK